jgi:polyisoprenoid-binding protein YceI
MTSTVYRIDSKHSQLHLEMEHLGGVSLLTARFAGFSGVLERDVESHSISFNATIDAGTISSALPTLDPLLIGPDMFDVGSHPSLGLALYPCLESSQAPVKGAISIRGTQKECAINLLSVRSAVNRRGHKVIGVRAWLIVQRSVFGVESEKTSTLSDEVRLTLNIEATDEPEN